MLRVSYEIEDGAKVVVRLVERQWYILYTPLPLHLFYFHSPTFLAFSSLSAYVNYNELFPKFKDFGDDKLSTGTGYFGVKFVAFG